MSHLPGPFAMQMGLEDLTSQVRGWTITKSHLRRIDDQFYRIYGGTFREAKHGTYLPPDSGSDLQMMWEKTRALSAFPSSTAVDRWTTLDNFDDTVLGTPVLNPLDYSDYTTSQDIEGLTNRDREELGIGIAFIPRVRFGLEAIPDPPSGAKPPIELHFLMKLTLLEEKSLSLQDIYDRLVREFTWFQRNRCDNRWKSDVAVSGNGHHYAESDPIKREE
ncbi:hypothetical protein B0H14DRAFT_2594514 [Mycena olivaceomarginata]|nr:hypothetical protein B0H14DRAFT_2594514 [Mycena olivaceomarginata]